MNRDEFYKNLCLAHSAKGTTWSNKNTKYTDRVKTANGYKYIYDNDDVDDLQSKSGMASNGKSIDAYSKKADELKRSEASAKAAAIRRTENAKDRADSQADEANEAYAANNKSKAYNKAASSIENQINTNPPTEWTGYESSSGRELNFDQMHGLSESLKRQANSAKRKEMVDSGRKDITGKSTAIEKGKTFLNKLFGKNSSINKTTSKAVNAVEDTTSKATSAIKDSVSKGKNTVEKLFKDIKLHANDSKTTLDMWDVDDNGNNIESSHERKTITKNVASRIKSTNLLDKNAPENQTPAKLNGRISQDTHNAKLNNKSEADKMYSNIEANKIREAAKLRKQKKK